VHALLYGGSLVAVGFALWWAVRRNWRAAIAAGAAGLLVYVVYALTDTIPSELATYSPQLVTLLVLAVASQRLRPPAADGLEYRRGVD
jgi:simple sugar transport system permease protein